MTQPTDQSSREPLPCPFCGIVGLDFSEGSTFRWLNYSCAGCGVGAEVRVQTLGDGTKDEWIANAKADAIKEWNTRTTPPTPITAEEAGREGEAKDGARLDWLEQQDLNDLSTIRQTNDVVGIHVGHGPYYGKTLRAAIDAAMLPPAPAQSGGQGNG